MELFSINEFKKLLERRDYVNLNDSGLENMTKILSELGYEKIPVFYRNVGGETYIFSEDRYNLLKLDNVEPRKPSGTNLKTLYKITEANPDFPSRFKSIFMRNKGDQNHIVIPFKETKLAFCPTYDFNQELIDRLDDPTQYNEDFYSGINTYLIDRYNENNPRIARVLQDIREEALIGDGTATKLYIFINEIVKKLGLLPKDFSKPLFDYLIDMKNFGFYTKLGSELTEDDFKKKVEVWTEGPIIICREDSFNETKLPRL